MSYRFYRHEPSRPVVLLLGWLGSKEQYVGKYRKLWEGLGAQVLHHQPSILQTAVPGVADRSLLHLMRDVTYKYSNLCTIRGEAPPVLVHAMSNAGFVAYGTMLHLVSLLRHVKPTALSPAPGGTAASLEFNPAAWASGGGGMTARSYGLWGEGGVGGRAVRRGADREELHRFVTDPRSMSVLSAFRQVLHNTQGIVIDSAPSQATPRIWSRGLLSALLTEPVQEVEEGHPLLLRTLHQLVERYFLLPQVVRRMHEVRHAWQYSVPPCPQLFLYSKADALIPYQHVERFMEQEAAHGVPVHHHCWDDTAHCEHLRKHPEQYRSLLRSFSEHCLHSHTPPESWI